MVIQDEYLPQIVVTFLDVGRILREECSGLNERGQTVVQKIEQWERDLLTGLIVVDASVTREKLSSRCRQALPYIILNALVVQHSALRVLSESDEALYGMSTAEATFWSEEGDGYWAMEAGKAAINSTWWPYYGCLRAWIDASAQEILEVLKESETILKTEADRQPITGVIEPCIQRIIALRARLKETNLADPQ